MIKNSYPMQGFHLIEILVVLAIICLFTTLALPKYAYYQTKLRYVEVSTMLLKLSLAMDEYHIIHHSYENVTLDVLHIPQWIAQHHYQLVIKNNAQDYTLLAKPIKTDPICGTFILQASGEKNMTGSGRIDDCW